MKRDDKVQVWDEKKVKCLGWGTVIEIVHPVSVLKKIMIFVMLDKSKKVVHGDRYQFIPEKKAIEISERIYGDLEKIKEEKEK